MSYNSDVMAKLAQEHFQVFVENQYGAPGTDALQKVLATARAIFHIRTPESFAVGLLVTARVDGSATNDADFVPAGGVHEIQALSDGVLVEVRAEGIFARPRRPDDLSTDIAVDCVVYEFAPRGEAFREAIVLPDREVDLPNPNGYPSSLAAPTFWELEDALNHYHHNLARNGTCKILKTAWADDGEQRRLAFVNHPEKIMRSSLAQHLRSSLRDHKVIRVNEEQNQSETEPVDIEVSWGFTTHIALLEIKWLGRCLKSSGDELATYTHSEARAREGVPQLEGYIDEAHERNPGYEIRGYLVVFDGRRKGVRKWLPGEVSAADAWHYKECDIDYGEAIPDRNDFRVPVRFYLEPKVGRPALSA